MIIFMYLNTSLEKAHSSLKCCVAILFKKSSSSFFNSFKYPLQVFVISFILSLIIGALSLLLKKSWLFSAS